ncbi:MAG: HAD family hydrolase, partial [Dehalococcoidia bacterium]
MVEDLRASRYVLSFDIDGTLDLGDPPGPITQAMVLRAKEAGFVIGSCSDRTPVSQQWIWDKMEIDPAFLARKHMLEEVKGRFEAEKYVHIGDRDLDKQFAEMAGFDFLWMHEAESEPWFGWLQASDQEQVVLSFDIDGTLDLGDPPGPITQAMVLR